ncbi:MAG: 30S ribosomal protein S20 [Desulfovibrio sp.]|nr:30S ribosomal protein S20 [Desulfovibrio sp.]
MANHKSAVKRHKQSLKRAARNRAARTRAKNAVKAVRVAVLEKDAAKAQSAFVRAASVLDKCAGKGAIHRRKAARKISRLAKALNSLGTNAQAPAPQQENAD